MKLTMNRQLRYWHLWLMLGLMLGLAACAPVAAPAQESTATAIATGEEGEEETAETVPITSTATITDSETMTSSAAMDDAAGLPSAMVGVIWQWQNSEVADPSRYTLEFTADGAVAVQADCNRGRGSYQMVGRAFFIEVLSLTRAACGPDSLEQRFLEQVNSTDTYRLEGDNLLLTLRVDPGMMTLTPADMSSSEASAAQGSTLELSAVEQQLVDRAMSLVAEEMSMAAAAFTVPAIEAMEWGDSSLGCPKPGESYMQVITPGYRITLEGPDGAHYQVHTASEPDGPLILCAEAEEGMSEENMSAELTGILTGTVMYRQRVALPASSVITVELQDVSRADAAAEIVAAQTITTTGENVPIPFELTYDPTQIDSRFRYAVRAQILIGGELRWTSVDHYGVLTNGNPTTEVTILLMPIE